MHLSIIVPAHNEEKRIGKMLDAYLPFFSGKYGEEVEFIVVINGSTDSTERVVEEYKRRYTCLTTVVDPNPIGKGGALIKGFRVATGDLIGFVDADGSTPPAAFQDLVDKIGDNDGIIASRWRKGANVSPSQPLFRLIASRCFNFIARIMFGLKFADSQCGAKLFCKDAIKNILPHLGITKWAFDVDLLFQFKRLGYVIKEIPTEWHDVEGSKISVVTWTALEMFVALMRLRLVYSPFRFIVAAYDKTIGPLILPADGGRDHLVKHSLVLLAGSQVSNILNLAFQLVIVRLLTGDGYRRYGVMVSMMSIFFIAASPLGALGRMLSHYVALFLQKGERERAKSLIRMVFYDCSVIALIVLVVGVLMSDVISDFFRLETSWPVIATVIALFGLFFKIIVDGVLNGTQAFLWASAVTMIWSAGRLVFAVLLVLLGFGATGAVWGNTIAIYISVLVGIFAVGAVLGRAWGGVGARERGVYGYFIWYMLVLGMYGVITNADMVLVKRFFNEKTAGFFAAAVIPARIVYFLPLPVAYAMFPKIVSAGNVSIPDRRILLKALVIVAFIEITIAVFISLFPSATLRILVGNTAHEMVSLMRRLTWAITPLPLVFVMMNFELAQRRFLVITPLALSVLVYIGGVGIWHKDLADVAFFILVSALLAFVGCVFVIFYWQRYVFKKKVST